MWNNWKILKTPKISTIIINLGKAISIPKIYYYMDVHKS